MPQLFGDQDRKIVPRWRPFRETVKTGELSSVQPTTKKEVPIDDLLRLKAEWRRNKTPSFAADVVSAAVAVDEPEQAKQEAAFLLDSKSIPAPARYLAERVLGKNPNETQSDEDVLDAKSTHKKIHDIRQHLWDDSYNVLGWSDLAFYYTIIGVHDKAVDAMENALRLAPLNRYILRSAARMFVHNGDLGRAHELLRTNERTPHDPWLLAAEIAVADARGRPPKFAITGRRTLNSGIDRFHLSELASAIGTLEINSSGATRRGRRHIEDSLEKPSENAVAQAAWASRTFGGFDMNGTIIRQSSEANTWDNYLIGNWRRAFNAAMAWFRDQPFSKHPPTIASYLTAVVFEKFGDAANIARIGLIANPGDPLLRNNLAFCLANEGNYSGASKEILDIQIEGLHAEVRGPILATRGMIAYRNGNPISGRALYLQAIEALQGSQSAVRAAIYMALEEMRACTPDATTFAATTIEKTAEYMTPDVRMLRDRLKQLIEGPPKKARAAH